MKMNYLLILSGFLAMRLCYLGFRYVQLSSLARAHGCKPVNRLPQLWLDRVLGLGYGLYRTDTAAAHAGQMLETALSRFRSLGHTFSGVIMGQRFIATTEPENAKAMLWEQQKAFQRGAPKQMKIILGESVFTSDGVKWKKSRVSPVQMPVILCGRHMDFITNFCPQELFETNLLQGPPHRLRNPGVAPSDAVVQGPGITIAC